MQKMPKTEKSGLDLERWLTPPENFYIQKTFYLGG